MAVMTANAEKAYLQQYILFSALLDGTSFLWPVLVLNAGWKLMFAVNEFKNGLHRDVQYQQDKHEFGTNLRPIIGLAELSLVLCLALLPQTQALVWPFLIAAVFNALWNIAAEWDILTDDSISTISFS